MMYLILDEGCRLQYLYRNESPSLSIKLKEFDSSVYFEETELTATSIHSIQHDNKVFIYVTASISHTSGPMYCTQCFQVTSEPAHKNNLIFTSAQKSIYTSYMPLHMTKVSFEGVPFILWTGSDKCLHTYEVDYTGGLHRSKFRNNIQQHWATRLETNKADSMATRILVQEWSGGSQGLVGYANGMFVWDRFPASSTKLDIVPTNSGKHGNIHKKLGDWLDWESPPQTSPLRLVGPVPKRTNQRQMIDVPNNSRTASPSFSPGIAIPEGLGSFVVPPSPPPPPTSKHHAFILDGVVSALAFYDSCCRERAHSFSPTSSTIDTYNPSDHVVVGTATGAIVLMALWGLGTLGTATAINDESFSFRMASNEFRGQGSPDGSGGGGVDESSNCILLPGSRAHGGVQAIEVADVQLTGYNDIVSISFVF